MSWKKPLSTVLKMMTMKMNTKESAVPLLEVAVSDLTQERWTWSKVVDAGSSSEEVWMQKYEPKMKEDIARCILGPKKKSRKEQGEKRTEEIWNLFISTHGGLKTIFPHRNFKLNIMSEL